MVHEFVVKAERKKITKAINNYWIPLLIYSFGIIKWRMLTFYRIHDPKLAVDRLTLPRSLCGRIVKNGSSTHTSCRSKQHQKCIKLLNKQPPEIVKWIKHVENDKGRKKHSCSQKYTWKTCSFTRLNLLRTLGCIIYNTWDKIYPTLNILQKRL